MCTDTFLRLPEEKQRRILDAAWEEFNRVKFEDASINQIIHRAGIPRGSFYQYFAGKEDLFDYLLSDIQEQFVRSFRELLDHTGGDIFQVPLLIFDRITGQGRQPRPLLDRCLRILRINPGLDLKRLVAGRLEQDMPPELAEKLNVESLRSQDPAFVRRVFLLSISVLGGALMDSFLRPERCGDYRRELELQLEIIRWGSLRAAPAKK